MLGRFLLSGAIMNGLVGVDIEYDHYWRGFSPSYDFERSTIVYSIRVAADTHSHKRHRTAFSSLVTLTLAWATFTLSPTII